jgi:hypothetical protein
MHLDQPFPLEAVPSRVKHPLLREFKGRCPSVREVDQIPDKHWLATPGIGPASLEAIRSITHAGRVQSVSHAASPRLSDGALLRHLEELQEELRWLEAELKARMSMGPRNASSRQRRNRTMQDDTDHLGQRVGEAKASDQRSDRDHAAYELAAPNGSGGGF